MPLIKEIFKHTVDVLEQIYDRAESESIAEITISEILNYDHTQFILNFNNVFPDSLISIYESYLSRLKQSEPIQYILNKAWFCNLELYVDKNVLIPRQETELLVDYIANKLKKEANYKRLLDIGTGSGCISVALKKNLPNLEVFACDISEKAIEIAQKNAYNNSVEIDFFVQDIFGEFKFPYGEAVFDIIVSNPPYVLNSEKAQMHKNVLEYEPSLALFVDDNNAMKFYERISFLAQNLLSEKGFVVYEINEKFSNKVIEVNTKNGFYKNFLLKDLNNKHRIIVAFK